MYNYLIHPSNIRISHTFLQIQFYIEFFLLFITFYKLCYCRNHSFYLSYYVFQFKHLFFYKGVCISLLKDIHLTPLCKWRQTNDIYIKVYLFFFLFCYSANNLFLHHHVFNFIDLSIPLFQLCIFKR